MPKLLSIPMRIQILLFILFVSCTIPVTAHEHNSPSQAALEFVANKGQWAQDFLFKARAPQADIYLENDGFTYVLSDKGNALKVHEAKHGKTIASSTLYFHSYRVKFLNAQHPSSVLESRVQPHYYNYFLGKNPDTWKGNIHPSLNVDYKDIYPNTDLHVGSEAGNLKYDFIVHEGGNPETIQIRIDGADGIYLQKGNIILKTSVGEVQELKPYAYQLIDGQRKTVLCTYKLQGQEISFDFPKGYHPNYDLVIDPTVVFATFSGSTSDNWGFTATYDAVGNFYAGGAVSGTTYPTTLGAFQTTFGGGANNAGNIGFPCDISITKFNPTGTALIYSTYLGGDQNEQPHSLVVNAAGELIMAGRTYSTNYPTTANAFDQTQNGGADMVVTKFNAAGSALLGSTYIGGAADDAVNIDANWGVLLSSLKHNYGDDARSEVLTDNAGNIYVAAPTQSNNFPVTANALQGTAQGAQDGVFVKLNANLSSIIYSTYLGGSGNDAAYVLALNTAQTQVYIGGGTESSNFPVSTSGNWPTYQGSIDGFIIRLTNSGNYALTAGTFIGTPGYDQCYGLQVDVDDNVYAMGNTLGGAFPVSPGVYNNPSSSQFIIKMSTGLNSRIYSTVFGSGNPNQTNMSPVAFLVDTCQNVYISGWGGPLANPSGGNLIGMPVTSDGIQTTTNGSGFYFIVLQKNVSSLLYGSFLASVGSLSGEHVDGGTSRFNDKGIIYQGICGGCGGTSNFPTTPGSWSPTNGSTNCNYLALKIAFNLSAVDATAGASPSAKGCPPLTVQFSNGSTNATTYLWDFGDGSLTSNAVTPTHTYTTPGVFLAKLTATNPNACKPVDTAIVTIVVDTNSIDAKFTVVKTDSCGPFRVNITNTSTIGTIPGASAWTKYFWDFGDGGTFVGQNPGNHTYAAGGTYTIKLRMVDSTACNTPDSFLVTVNFNASNVLAKINLPDSLCYTGNLIFGNGSTNATSYLWRFGDGNTSTVTAPTHTYASVGTYNVVLVATNPNTCNKVDSAFKSITLLSGPTADFDFSPVVPTPNEPISFTNKSIGAVSYSWSFGDGNSSTLKDPQHTYNTKGEHQVCLVARSSNGCADTLCKKVISDVRVAIDVPSAFTPNGDGVNDILFVRGAAVKTMTFKIYNRWGEMIFESNNLLNGWDGKYKGVLQEMESYAYTLEATFIDETVEVKKGNVTLIR